MAKRPIRKKQAARLRKQITRAPLPAFTDLIAWLKVRGYAQTTGEARQVILDGRVKADSHVLGVHRGVPVRALDGTITHQDIVDPAIPVERMKNVTVTAA